MKATVKLDDVRVTGRYPHFIGAWTVGMMTELKSHEREAVEAAFNAAPKGDHFYTVKLTDAPVFTVFVAYNGELGYTAMLPSEY